MKSPNHTCAISRCFLLMTAIPAVALAASQSENSEPQSLICTPEEASIIYDKKTEIKKGHLFLLKDDKYLFTKFGDKWEVVYYPSYLHMFSNCRIDDKQAFCYSDSVRLPSTGEFTYYKKSDSTYVFTSFLTYIYSDKESASAITMGYCKPFKK